MIEKKRSRVNVKIICIEGKDEIGKIGSSSCI